MVVTEASRSRCTARAWTSSTPFTAGCWEAAATAAAGSSCGRPTAAATGPSSTRGLRDPGYGLRDCQGRPHRRRRRHHAAHHGRRSHLEARRPARRTGSYQVHMATSTAGFALAQPLADGVSTVLRTADGGRTWTVAYAAGGWYSDIAVVDALTAIVACERWDEVTGSRQIVLRTTDGGGTWVELPPPKPDVAPGENAQIQAVAAAGPDHIWVWWTDYGDPMLSSTSTGGAVWSTRSWGWIVERRLHRRAARVGGDRRPDTAVGRRRRDLAQRLGRDAAAWRPSRWTSSRRRGLGRRRPLVRRAHDRRRRDVVAGRAAAGGFVGLERRRLRRRAERLGGRARATRGSTSRTLRTAG